MGEAPGPHPREVPLLRRRSARVLVVAALLGVAVADERPSPAELRRQVEDAERAFARTMADRDHAAFLSFLSDDAVFLSEKATLRGKPQVGEAWKRLYEGPEAPFSWEPERIEVLDSGTLALSTGPVRDPQGKCIGTFNSIWRREADGKWRVIFDKGGPACSCPKTPGEASR